MVGKLSHVTPTRRSHGTLFPLSVSRMGAMSTWQLSAMCSLYSLFRLEEGALLTFEASTGLVLRGTILVLRRPLLEILAPLLLSFPHGLGHRPRAGVFAPPRDGRAQHSCLPGWQHRTSSHWRRARGAGVAPSSETLPMTPTLKRCQISTLNQSC